MAVEVQRFSERFAGRRRTRHLGQTRWSARVLSLHVAAIGREAGPYILSAVMIASPFVVYSVGQARLTAALNHRTHLLTQIQNDRIEITELRDQLRAVLAPANLASWAKKHKLQPTSDVEPLVVEPARNAAVVGTVAQATGGEQAP